MKHLVIIFIIITSAMECGSMLKNQHSEVRCNLEDSIIATIIDQKFIYYTRGHHGHIWSLVISEKNHYIIVSGNTLNDDWRFDTITINVPVLKWGLDTMSQYCQKMKPVSDYSYWPFHERLILCSPKDGIIFDCIDTDAYNGTDSAQFNNKLNELKYLMYWFAVPIEIQKKLLRPL